jgi:hypothetical protein
MEASPFAPAFVPAAAVTSFEEELHLTLRRRLRLVLVIGFMVAVAAHLFYQNVTGLDPEIYTPFAPWIDVIYDLFVVSVGLATLLLFSRDWSTPGLLAIDYTLITFNILLAQFIAVAFDRNEIPVFAISILLFVHAAFIPVPVLSQVGLAVTAALGFPLMAGVLYTWVPEIRGYWLENGGIAAFRAPVLEGTFQLIVLAVISVVITKLLYHIRLSLHRAQRLGNYVIERELGRGGMGQVFVAQHALMCRPTAVKVMDSGPGDGHLTMARFEREVRLSSTLSHPNTITIYDYGRTGKETLYYAMEYLEGLNLEELVAHFGPVPPERTIFILDQVCGSLSEAHDKQIIHRDIKPSNIFLTHRGGLWDFVKVLDFGLAKEIRSDESDTITKTGVVLGTPRYIAPEAANATERMDGRADLYCLGGVAYWMLAGRPPFEAPSSVQVIVHHLRTPAEAPSTVSEICIPPGLDAIVMRCLAKDPAQRFQSASELRVALRDLRFGRPWTHELAEEWWSLHRPGSTRRKEP